GGGEAQVRLIVLFFRPLVQGRLLLVGGLGAGNRRVAPVGGPDVVGPDARDEVFDSDAVFGLRDVVEAGVVHDGGRVAHLVDEVLVADLVGGVLAAGFHVVLEAQGVAHFVA